MPAAMESPSTDLERFEGPGGTRDVMTADSALTEDEIIRICGDLKQPRRQLKRLHQLGYHRAFIGSNNKVVLERPHFEAVSSGTAAPAKPKARPQPDLSWKREAKVRHPV